MAKEKKPKKKKSKEKTFVLNLELRIANKSDFMELDRYLEGEKKKFKIKLGVTYWMVNFKGEIENQPYILTEETDKSNFADWLVREQILIPVGRFEK